MADRIGAVRAVQIIAGIVLAMLGIAGVAGTCVFAKWTAWQLPAWILLSISLLIALGGILLLVLGWTAKTRRQATRRLVGSSVLTLMQIVAILAANLVLGALAPNEADQFKSTDPTCDSAPFLAAIPVCDTGAADIDPLQAHYAPNLRLRHCTSDFDVWVQTDELGMRRIGTSFSEPPTLAIGDSFCFGWGVADDHTYASLLGFRNAGLWGRPPSVHLKALQWWSPRLRPRRIIWELYPPHMITELPDGWLSAYQYPGLRTERADGVLDWYHTTGIGRFLHQRFGIAINRANYYTKERILYEVPGPALQGVYVRLTQQLIEAGTLTRELGIEMWFVLVPSKYMLSLHRGDATTAAMPMRRLQKAITDAGVSPERVIDLLPEFGKSNWRDGMYFAHDAHWTAAGHRLAADVIARSLGPAALRP